MKDVFLRRFGACSDCRFEDADRKRLRVRLGLKMRDSASRSDLHLGRRRRVESTKEVLRA